MNIVLELYILLNNLSTKVNFYKYFLEEKED